MYFDPSRRTVTVAALRFPRLYGRANRAASSKSARFFRHWRCFAGFHARPQRHFAGNGAVSTIS